MTTHPASDYLDDSCIGCCLDLISASRDSNLWCSWPMTLRIKPQCGRLMVRPAPHLKNCGVSPPRHASFSLVTIMFSVGVLVWTRLGEI